MIKSFNYGKTKEKYLGTLLEFIKTNRDTDFYLTKNNKRIYIQTIKDLRTFLKSSDKIYIDENYQGIILLWKGFGADIKRYYIKLNAINKEIANKLLTVLLWNTNQDLYIKLNKKSKFLEIFKNKNFKFSGGRGKQILLYRKYIKPEVS